MNFRAQHLRAPADDSRLPRVGTGVIAVIDLCSEDSNQCNKAQREVDAKCWEGNDKRTVTESRPRCLHGTEVFE